MLVVVDAGCREKLFSESQEKQRSQGGKKVHATGLGLRHGLAPCKCPAAPTNGNLSQDGDRNSREAQPLGKNNEDGKLEREAGGCQIE